MIKFLAQKELFSTKALSQSLKSEVAPMCNTALAMQIRAPRDCLDGATKENTKEEEPGHKTILKIIYFF